jgi:hypothetical protein
MQARSALIAAAAVLLLLVDGGACAMYKVGDLDAWGVPPSSKPDVYKKWAKSINFKLGDAICKHTLFSSPVLFCVHYFVEPMDPSAD